MSNQQDSHQLSPQLLSSITVHGFFLWASMGFLIPVGILTIRMSNSEKNANRLKILFYVHAVSQTLSVLLVTIAAIMSIRSFENSFNNTHQKIGVVLYGAVWLQALIGVLRPHRGAERRNLWFFVHWAFGTSISVLGIINIYTGLQAYKKKKGINNIRIWSILFTCQVSLMFFFYLFQDKWDYIQKQRVVSGDALPTKPIDHRHRFSPDVRKTELLNEHC